VTINLEHLGDNTPADRNFRKLAKETVDTGGISLGIRGGGSSATWTASPSSANVTIAHGLGIVPLSEWLTSYNGNLRYIVVSKNSTNLVVQGFFIPGTNLTGTFSFDWGVIG